jgi:hypothetical protein
MRIFNHSPVRNYGLSILLASPTFFRAISVSYRTDAYLQVREENGFHLMELNRGKRELVTGGSRAIC